MKRLYFLSFFIFISFISYAQPANDACPNAILIPTVVNFCSANGAGTTVASTDDVATSGGFGVATCWGGTVNDVWYKFVATASDVTITINGNQGSPVGGTLNRPQVALYSGTCATTLNELVCGSAPAGQNIIQVYRGGLTIGETYLIRIDGVNANKGTFQYCINNYNPVPVPSSDCPTAVALCSKDPFTVPSVSGAGTNNSEMNDAACFGGGTIESNSTWYAFTFATSGTFNFILSPSNTGDDLDFVVYKLPNGIGNCTGKSVQRCMASAPDCTPGGANANTSNTGLTPTATFNDEYSGCNADLAYFLCGIGANRCQSQFARELTVVAGETYALAINNFTSTGNGFSIVFGGTAQIQGPTAVINDSDADDQICPGEVITFTDGSTPPPLGTLVQWTWNFGVGATPSTYVGQNPPTVTYTTTGVKTISLTVKSNKGCLETVTKNITVTNVPPTVSILESTNSICPGTNVTFTATPVNAGAAPTYQWYLNGNPVGTNSNTYSNNTLINNDQVKVTVTSNSSCNSGLQATSNIVTMIISSPLPVDVTITGNAAICPTASLTLTANPTNGGATPAYQWFLNGNPVGSNSNTYSSTSFNNIDVVTVRLTSSLGCVSGNPKTSNPITVTVKPNPVVSANSPSICDGLTATLTATGATTYTWTGGLTGNPATTLALNANTSYTVTGTTNGCTGTAIATVTVKPNPIVTVNSPSICNGQTATLTAGGATTYSWTGGLSGNPATTLALSTNTNYTVTGTTNGCTGTAVATVTVKPKPIVTVNSPSICDGQTATLTANGATTYTWTGGLSGNPATTGALSSNQTYTVTGTTNGCTGTAVATVTVKPKPVVSVNSPSICDGKTATLTAAGATTYTWTGGLTGNPATTLALNANTSYTVTGTTNGCTGTAVATVTVKPNPIVTVNSPSICNGQTAILTAGGATTYTWTGGLSGNPATTLALSTNTNYTVTGTSNGCIGTAIATVTVKPNPTVTVNSPFICTNQTATLTANGATTYTWTGGLVGNPATTNPLPSTATFTVTGTTNGCTGTATSTVTVKPNLTINVNSPNICDGQSTTLTASGGTTYTWTGGLPPNASVSTGVLSSTQIYTVTGTTNGCTGTAIATVTVTPNPIVTINSPSICAGKTATLIANGAASYTWTGGLSGNPATTLALSSNQNYTVTGTTNGCTGTAIATITVKPNPIVTVNSSSICDGLTTTLTANGATTYAWTGGLVGNPVTTLALNSNQSYIVTGTTNGCTGTATSTVTVKPNPIVTVNSPSICDGQFTTLTANGATTYTWTGGLTGNPATTLPLSSNQIYTVTGTKNGCTGVATSTVTVKPNPVVTVNSPVICSGQTATLTANGATTYVWSGGLPPNAIVTTLPLNSSQTFTVKGTTNGCSSTLVNSVVTVNPTKITNITRSICSDQSVAIGSQTFNTSGLHTVVLQTSKNCDSTVNLTLNVTTVLTPTVSILSNKNDICKGDAVVFTANAQNTRVTPTYQWFLNGNPVGTNSNQFSSSTLNNNDKVEVIINTTASCLTTNSVTSNSIIMKVSSIDYAVNAPPYCTGKSSFIDLNIPQPAYSVFWKNGTDTFTTTNVDSIPVNYKATTNVQAIIKYGNGCSKTVNIIDTVYQLPAIDAVVDKPNAKYEEEVQLNVNGGGTLQYNWIPSSVLNNDSIKNPTSIITATTLFSVVVKDKNGCVNTDSVKVNLINECTNDYIYVPSAFSPNNDGVNDCFSIISPPKLTDYRMIIFDRWNEKIFETNNTTDCWNGRYKGAEAESDSYIYVITFTCYNGKPLTKQGTVTLLK